MLNIILGIVVMVVGAFMFQKIGKFVCVLFNIDIEVDQWIIQMLIGIITLLLILTAGLIAYLIGGAIIS